MTRKLSAARAKSQLADCLRKAESGEPVIITRHGKAVAALVAVDRVAVGTRGQRRTDAGLASLVGGWKGSDQLAKALGRVRRTRPRRPTALD
jgi:prevent-host-death family protein